LPGDAIRQPASQKAVPIVWVPRSRPISPPPSRKASQNSWVLVVMRTAGSMTLALKRSVARAIVSACPSLFEHVNTMFEVGAQIGPEQSDVVEMVVVARQYVGPHVQLGRWADV